MTSPALSPAPAGLFLFRGAHRVRRFGWVFDVARLTCPDGHRIKTGFSMLREDGTIPCTHRAKQGARECGALVHVSVVHNMARVRRFFAADVSPEEARMFARELFTIEQVQHYCGAAFPGQEMPR